MTKIAERLIKEITTRLKFLIDVGLPYLTLDRLSSSLVRRGITEN